MADPGMIDGAVIAVAAFLAGQWLPRPHRRRAAPKAPEPVCGCKHHHSFHGKTGECHALMYVPGTMSRSSHHTACTCRQYSGPVPLAEVYAQEITDG
jgi:hypothetical protein